MGYEGHLMMVTDREKQRADVAASMDLLVGAHADVGGDVVSAVQSLTLGLVTIALAALALHAAARAFDRDEILAA